MATKRSRNHKVRGTYALVLYLPRAQTVRVGKLGVFKFPRGYYIYVGSALNGLAQRIARHLRPDKKRFWHIDYLLEHAQLKEVWTHQGDGRLECLWARAALALPRAKIGAPRFGASDCDCPAHLIYFGAAMPKFGRGKGEV
ncbi:MAG: GIY-YIG nuclease family protein [Chloroflexota bacterium]